MSSQSNPAAELSESQLAFIADPLLHVEVPEVFTTADGKLYVSRVDILAGMELVSEQAEQTWFELADKEVSVDAVRREVRVAGEVIDLRKSSFNLALFLARKKDSVVEKPRIKLSLWGSDDELAETSLRVTLRRLREALGEPHSDSAKGTFRTVHGVGIMAVSHYE